MLPGSLSLSLSLSPSPPTPSYWRSEPGAETTFSHSIPQPLLLLRLWSPKSNSINHLLPPSINIAWQLEVQLIESKRHQSLRWWKFPKGKDRWYISCFYSNRNQLFGADNLCPQVMLLVYYKHSSGTSLACGCWCFSGACMQPAEK